MRVPTPLGKRRRVRAGQERVIRGGNRARSAAVQPRRPGPEAGSNPSADRRPRCARTWRRERGKGDAAALARRAGRGGRPRGPGLFRACPAGALRLPLAVASRPGRCAGSRRPGVAGPDAGLGAPRSFQPASPRPDRARRRRTGRGSPPDQRPPADLPCAPGRDAGLPPGGGNRRRSPRPDLPDPGGLLRGGARAGTGPGRRGPGDPEPSAPSRISEVGLRRRLPGLGPDDRLPVHLHLRRIPGPGAGSRPSGPTPKRWRAGPCPGMWSARSGRPPTTTPTMSPPTGPRPW